MLLIASTVLFSLEEEMYALLAQEKTDMLYD